LLPLECALSYSLTIGQEEIRIQIGCFPTAESGIKEGYRL
jgi:hypothetical protein